MKTIENISRMSTLSKIMRKDGRSIGFVPTMGALHEGHLSLARTARKHADVVVMSIFVNPMQFGPSEDLEKYPHDLTRDEELARNAGVDILFCPSVSQMYPDGFSTYANVEKLSDGMCGVVRPGHFRGVTTAVLKLFSIVKPDIAYFGQKDAQQAVIIRKMVKDLNLDIDIKILPIIREKDGLAMSSRNIYLSDNERKDAAILYQSLKKAEELIAGGEKDPNRIRAAMESMIREKPTAKIEYISLVDSKDLSDLKVISGETLVALAVYVGKTRLIDNIIVKGKA